MFDNLEVIKCENKFNIGNSIEYIWQSLREKTDSQYEIQELDHISNYIDWLETLIYHGLEEYLGWDGAKLQEEYWKSEGESL